VGGRRSDEDGPMLVNNNKCIEIHPNMERSIQNAERTRYAEQELKQEHGTHWERHADNT
jgi:hypothetical protein